MDEITETEKIENMIYEIRGKQVMLDSDLARLYGCKNGTKEVNQAVKNNIEKFPERYCFQLNDFEKKILRSKILTAKSNSKSRTNPRVFTEQGIYMLATVLKSKNATNMTLFIMDAFVYMKKYILNDSLNSKMLTNHEERILKLEESFDKLSAKQNSIIYEGCIYDSYSLLLDILNEAYEEIIIVDNYANKELFDILKNINKLVDISKFNRILRIAKDFVARRWFMNARKYNFPIDKCDFYGIVDNRNISKSDWWKSEIEINQVMMEFINIGKLTIDKELKID